MSKSESGKSPLMEIKAKMYNGDRKLIIDYLSADFSYAYGQMLAIAACVKNRYTDEEVFHLLERLQKSEESIIGVFVCDLATAALHELGMKEYTGDDFSIRGMIEDHFSFALEDKTNTANNGEKHPNS